MDTLAASMGQGLLVYYAVEMRKKGEDIMTVKDWLEDNKLNDCQVVLVDDLYHLQRGGRLSKTAAVFGSMLGVKPILILDDKGALVPIKKIRGRKNALDALVKHMDERTKKLSCQK